MIVRRSDYEMTVFSKVHKLFLDDNARFSMLSTIGIFKIIDDEIFLKILYQMRMKKRLNLNFPNTFNEKLQWLKLYDRNPAYSIMVDKYEVKNYISSLIRNDYIIPTLGLWERFDDIDFDSLPSQFVLKCTHDSGSTVICKQREDFEIDAARDKLGKCLKRNYYWHGREWPYKNIKPRIMAEPYLEDESTRELRDYKFFTFNGVPKAMFIATDRGSSGETKFDFFDMDFNHLPFTNGHPNANIMPPKPTHFEEMKLLASKLSQNIPQLRVDFYEANGRVYFGELTFFHWSGMMPFDPPEWDTVFGEWITLPDK